ncbi:hypothetical protein [Streptomyces phaeolivaceus]|uniref:hypothetical protein n=1 Tax=Streptomyces phaeolivaceus TaxID=2653200 RepID=UPI001D048C28|nr:hypothetical protein [Streptomyces phaeolivaceus]
MATRLGDGLKTIPDIGLLATPQVNILFCRLPQHVTESLLAEGYAFYHDRWEPGVVRFVTAFSHTPEDVDQLLGAIRRAVAQSPAGITRVTLPSVSASR